MLAVSAEVATDETSCAELDNSGLEATEEVGAKVSCEELVGIAVRLAFMKLRAVVVIFTISEAALVAFILETAVRDGKVMQDFDSELFKSGDSHSQKVKGSPLLNDSGSKDGVRLPSPTAVSRIMALTT